MPPRPPLVVLGSRRTFQATAFPLVRPHVPSEGERVKAKWGRCVFVDEGATLGTMAGLHPGLSRPLREELRMDQSRRGLIGLYGATLQPPPLEPAAFRLPT